MVSQSSCFSQYDEFHACPCYCHVHPAQIIQKSYLAFFVGTYQTDENHVTLLPLKSVDGVDRYQAAVRTQGGAAFYLSPQVLHLRLVGRDQPEVDTFLKNTASAYPQDVCFQFFQQ